MKAIAKHRCSIAIMHLRQYILSKSLSKGKACVNILNLLYNELLRYVLLDFKIFLCQNPNRYIIFNNYQTKGNFSIYRDTSYNSKGSP